MTDLIRAINALRDVPRSDLGPRVKRVAVILTSPRSGSSLVKSVLAAHPDIASMDGEIEPFLALTENGFGYNSDSDAIRMVSNKGALADNVLDDLTVPSDTLPPPDEFRARWERRLLLQFPGVFAEAGRHADLARSLVRVVEDMAVLRDWDERALQALVLSRVFRNDPWRIHYYDGYLDSCANVLFREPVKIEEPPFVVPRIKGRRFAADDAETKTLLFKAPPDVYRIGMYEQLFPHADVKYIHLTRGYAQSVNGLIDGWLSPMGFFSHKVGHAGRLDIKGYSDLVGFGREWWKFDLPPNWRAFTRTDLDEVCLNQWMSAHDAILASGVQALRVGFEGFLLDPSGATRRMTDYLGLGKMNVPPVLPAVMAIAPPRAGRWRRRSQLLRLGERTEVRDMMRSLQYDLDPRTWL